MANDFSGVMAKRSNADLIKIVTQQRDHYQPEALIAAETELKNRNLDLKEVETAEMKITYDNAVVEFNANRPLEPHWKVLTFLFPGILQIFISHLFSSEGYERKAKELRKWTLRGVYFYAGIFILLILVTIIFE